MLAERKKKVKWSLNPRGNLWAQDTNKFGQRMLEKMGWKSGSGLGVNEQGITEHIKVAYKSDTKCIGYQDHGEQWVEHQSQFESLLSELSSSHDAAVSDTTEKVPNSLEERSRQSRARVHYQKFTRGKDLSNYSDKDLACILGVKKPGEKSQDDNDLELKNDADSATGQMNNLYGITTVNGGTMNDYLTKMKRRSILKSSKTSENNDDSDNSTDLTSGKSKLKVRFYDNLLIDNETRNKKKIIDRENSDIQENDGNEIEDAQEGNHIQDAKLKKMKKGKRKGASYMDENLAECNKKNTYSNDVSTIQDTIIADQNELNNNLPKSKKKKKKSAEICEDQSASTEFKSEDNESVKIECEYSGNENQTSEKKRSFRSNGSKNNDQSPEDKIPNVNSMKDYAENTLRNGLQDKSENSDFSGEVNSKILVDDVENNATSYTVGSCESGKTSKKKKKKKQCTPDELILELQRDADRNAEDYLQNNETLNTLESFETGQKKKKKKKKKLQEYDVNGETEYNFGENLESVHDVENCQELPLMSNTTVEADQGNKKDRKRKQICGSLKNDELESSIDKSINRSLDTNGMELVDANIENVENKEKKTKKKKRKENDISVSISKVDKSGETDITNADKNSTINGESESNINIGENLEPEGDLENNIRKSFENGDVIVPVSDKGIRKNSKRKKNFEELTNDEPECNVDKGIGESLDADGIKPLETKIECEEGKEKKKKKRKLNEQSLNGETENCITEISTIFDCIETDVQDIDMKCNKTEEKKKKKKRKVTNENSVENELDNLKENNSENLDICNTSENSENNHKRKRKRTKKVIEEDGVNADLECETVRNTDDLLNITNDTSSCDKSASHGRKNKRKSEVINNSGISSEVNCISETSCVKQNQNLTCEVDNYETKPVWSKELEQERTVNNVNIKKMRPSELAKHIDPSEIKFKGSNLKNLPGYGNFSKV